MGQRYSRGGFGTHPVQLIRSLIVKTSIRRSCAGRNLKRYVQRFLLSQERRVKALVFNDLFRVSLKPGGQRFPLAQERRCFVLSSNAITPRYSRGGFQTRPVTCGLPGRKGSLVENGAAHAAAGRNNLTRNRPGLVGGQEGGQEPNFLGVHHPADGVAPARTRGEVLLLHLFR